MKSDVLVPIIVCVTIVVLLALISASILVGAALRYDSAEIVILNEYIRIINVPPDVTCEVTAVDPHIYVVRCSP